MLSNLVIIVVIVWFTYKQIKIAKEQIKITEEQKGITIILDIVVDKQKEIKKEQIEIAKDISVWQNSIRLLIQDTIEQQNTQHNEIFQELRIIAKQLNSIDRKYIEISQEQNTIARQLNMMVNNDKN